ncbi:MAG: ABC transporter permease [Oscillospiraceae bacterium]|nr:ABC transporter permease [Oscillospiraceae bacterium]
MNQFIEKIKKNKFLFEELVKRDFNKKYKRTALGMLWSMLAPLLNVLVLLIVFTHVFSKTQAHFIVYVFSGTLVLSYYSEATTGAMRALMANSAIFSKIKVPKFLFVLSRVSQSFINFLLTLVVYFIVCIVDGIPISPRWLLLIFPIVCLTAFNLGVGEILSYMFVIFRDIEYLYTIFLTLLGYVSAVFYPISIIPENYQRIFLLNPVYVYIKYFRCIVIDGSIPSAEYHFLSLGYAAAVLLIGTCIKKKYDNELLYYI